MTSKNNNKFSMEECLRKSKVFENKIREILSKEWEVDLKERKVKIGNIDKKFDLVSEDFSYVGDVKYYKNLKVPAAKWSTIAEYVWLLEKIDAKHRFLIFGNSKEVPERWLKRFRELTDIEFYFFDESEQKLYKL